MAKRILTGIRVNSDLHLGNYLGAIKPMVDIQNQMEEGDELFMFIPDLHSFTTPVDHSTLYTNTMLNIRYFISAGLNPTKNGTFMYRQSVIPAHSELAWVLANFTYFGEANRMTEFKDKSEKLGHKAVTVGLFAYPILMAADILLYDAQYVPVGDDQKQHLELTRTLAERMNKKFGELFTVPKPWQEQLEFSQTEHSVRIKSLSNPANKMSKSIDDPKGTIALSDNPDEAAARVMSATTDSVGKINYNPVEQPGIANLLDISALLLGKPLAEVEAQWAGQENYGVFKQAVAEQVREFLQNLQAKMAEIDDAKVLEYLETGEQSVSAIAAKKMEQVQSAIGLIRI